MAAYDIGQLVIDIAKPDAGNWCQDWMAMLQHPALGFIAAAAGGETPGRYFSPYFDLINFHYNDDDTLRAVFLEATDISVVCTLNWEDLGGGNRLNTIVYSLDPRSGRTPVNRVPQDIREELGARVDLCDEIGSHLYVYTDNTPDTLTQIEWRDPPVPTGP